MPTKQNEFTKPLYVRLDIPLKQRLLNQVYRLNISQAAIVKQALIKFLEEEEKIEATNRI